MNKKSQTGLVIRIIAGVLTMVSTPFLVVTPSNSYAQLTFGLGGFLFIIGGLTQ